MNNTHIHTNHHPWSQDTFGDIHNITNIIYNIHESFATKKDPIGMYVYFFISTFILIGYIILQQTNISRHFTCDELKKHKNIINRIQCILELVILLLNFIFTLSIITYLNKHNIYLALILYPYCFIITVFEFIVLICKGQCIFTNEMDYTTYILYKNRLACIYGLYSIILMILFAIFAKLIIIIVVLTLIITLRFLIYIVDYNININLENNIATTGSILPTTMKHYVSTYSAN